MCGHVGIAGDLETKDEMLMKRLLCYDYFRGPDSTGLASFSKISLKAKIAKIASHPFDIFDYGPFRTALAGYSSSVFLGHNRAATVGVVNGYNAHPYQYGHIVGAHNGTLTSESLKAIEAAVGEEFDVDSMAVFAAIEKLGIEKTVPLLQGAWALVWVNQKEKTLNFLRNDKRPFWMAYSKDCKKLFWASEHPMINAACALGAKQELYTEEDTEFSFWSTSVDTHYSVLIEDITKGGSKPVTFKKTERKGKKPTPVQSTSSNTGKNWKRANKPSKDSSKNTVVNLFATPDQPLAGFMTKQEFDNISYTGCDWCGGPVGMHDEGLLIVEKDDLVMCPSCTNLETTRIYAEDLTSSII